MQPANEPSATTPKPPAETPTYGLWQIHDMSSFHRVRASVDSLTNFMPLGWSAPWGDRRYSDPRQPLQYRDWGAEVSPDGEHWTNVLTVGTPIYDEVCEDLGFQPR